jgi:invasion protein IalB
MTEPSTRARSALSALAVLAAVAFSPAPAGAAELIEISGDWQAFTATDEKGRRICFAGSHPVKSEGNYTKRGEPFLLVTHWPADDVFGEVRFDAGYPIKEGSRVTLTSGGTTVRMSRLAGESAWADSTNDDKALVAAIRAGTTLIVKGISSRGTHTTDTFSLKGSSAALKAIDRVCGRR